MTAAIAVAQRLCEQAACDNPLVKYPNESRPRFELRRYCSKACAAAARRVHPAKPNSGGANPGLNTAPPPTPPRYEDGVWRPNAPGWPAAPHIPSRSTQRTR